MTINSIRTVLLGAGASVEAEVPAAKDMVEKIYQAPRQSEFTKKAIETVIGGLRFQRSVIESDPFGLIDIEELYEVLQALSNRHSSFLAPFVGSWSHAIASAERPHVRSAARGISRALGQAVDRYVNKSIEAIKRGAQKGPSFGEDELESALFAGLSLTAGDNQDVFGNAAYAVLEELKSLTWINNEHKVHYIEPMLESASRTRLWIASLNYDNSIELAAKNRRLNIDLGIRSNEASIRFADESRICLAKLHGSTNWSYDDNGKLCAGDEPSHRATLIFGAGNKLRVDGPYLDLMFAFRTQLEASDELDVCGYSFRDQHINHILVNWLDSKNNRIVSVFDTSLTAKDIERNVRKSMPENWWIRHSSFISRVSVEQLKTSEWINSRFQN